MALSTIQNNSFADTAVHGFRNLIINGAMQVAQRGTSAALTSGNFTLDRFKTQSALLDDLAGTMTQDSDAPSGFGNSLKITTTTAEASIAADEYFYVSQFIEAQNLQQLGFGGSSANSITLSFWVKSSQTGVFGISLYTPDNAGIANSTYTINAVSTWEYKTLTFTGDTSRAINNDTGIGMYVNFHLAAGTNLNSDPTDGNFEAYSDAKWAGGHVQNGVITTTSATWQITGVQLEVGSEATPFEHRPYADELRRCQRYFSVPVDNVNEDGASNTVSAIGVGRGAASGLTVVWALHCPVPMRDRPALATSGEYWITDSNSRTLGTPSTAVIDQFSVDSTILLANYGFGSVVCDDDRVNMVGARTSVRITLDAEL